MRPRINQQRVVVTTQKTPNKLTRATQNKTYILLGIVSHIEGLSLDCDEKIINDHCCKIRERFFSNNGRFGDSVIEWIDEALEDVVSELHNKGLVFTKEMFLHNLLAVFGSEVRRLKSDYIRAITKDMQDRTPNFLVVLQMEQLAAFVNISKTDTLLSEIVLNVIKQIYLKAQK